ncbi:hypothetical protein [Burkholderia glumae]|uniref:hypothetical protein n=1 Tax=Burkholderia glumae TaxID=337 RepID=UPI001463D9ED|nr:hypothetical protein [Burkholderia glumae]QJP69295.1 hypothetical protein HJC54_02560 [Burkholderia glumae]
MALISLSQADLSGERRFFGFVQTNNENIRGQAVFSASLRPIAKNSLTAPFFLASQAFDRRRRCCCNLSGLPGFHPVFRNSESPNSIITLKSFQAGMSKFEKARR